mgnify:CR=1 FL=1
MSSANFRAYTSTDIVGVEVGGAVKNVLALAAGLSDGLGFGANSRIALITRGLTEMVRLGVALGASRETFMGLAGLGDLVLSCTDDQSRNRRFGVKAVLVGFGAGLTGVVVPGCGLGRGVGVVTGGTTMATSIVSSSLRPITCLTSRRGRSSRSA